MAKTTDDLKKRSGAELRAMAEQRVRERPGPVSKRQADLAKYKAVIVRRQRDFVETGTALGLIAKEQLFKDDGYASFEEFVAAEFDMSRPTAYRLVDAARVVTILSQVGTVESKIKNQSQALALAPLAKDRDAMVLVIAAAEARTEKLTADVLAEVRGELYPHTKVIEGEIVGDRPALVEGVRAALESVEEHQKKKAAATEEPAAADEDPRSGGTSPSAGSGNPSTADELLVSSDGAQATPSTTPPPAAGVGASADRPTPAVTPQGHPEAAVTGEVEAPASTPLVPEQGSGTGDEADSGKSPQGPDEADRGQEPSAGVSSVPAPTPDQPDAVGAIAVLAEVYERIDVDVVGPMLTAAEMTEIGESLDRIVTVVELLTLWRERTQP